MSKRGQVTVFIILGIVLIVAISLFIYLGKQTTTSDISREEAEVFFATQIDPIKKFVQDCTLASAFVVLETMGQYSGYVMPVYDLNDPHLELFMPDEEIVTVNYAAYQEQCPADYIRESGCFVNDFPSTVKMKHEFESYLENVALNPDIPSVFSECINDFNQFKQDFDDIDYGTVDTTVFFEDKIVIILNFPINIKKGDYNSVVNDYLVEIPINMKEIRAVSSSAINLIIEGGRGTELLKFKTDLTQRYTSELSNGDREDVIFIAGLDADVPYDTEVNSFINYFFRLEYNNPKLVDPYKFNFLVGVDQ